MKKAASFQFVILVLLAVVLILYITNQFPPWIYTYGLYFLCIIFGGIGGVTYCLRGVYISACVMKNWDDEWLPWYYIRPFVSMIIGGISSLFLKAGLILLESNQESEPTYFTFYALAFIAGLNVDNFVKKIEDISKTTFGIERSRSSKRKEGG